MAVVDAIERCAYCREYVPVTVVDVATSPEQAITGRVAVCETCKLDGR